MSQEKSFMIFFNQSLLNLLKNDVPYKLSNFFFFCLQQFKNIFTLFLCGRRFKLIQKTILFQCLLRKEIKCTINTPIQW